MCIHFDDRDESGMTGAGKELGIKYTERKIGRNITHKTLKRIMQFYTLV